jgi:hypothetical protein
MRDKNLILIVSVVSVLLAPSVLIAQNGSPGAPPAKPYSTPKTPWGEPDLQGTFSNRTITPFERPANVNGREFFTPQEVAAMEKSATERSGDEGDDAEDIAGG